MEEESFAKHEKAVVQSKVNALEAVNKMDLPKVIAISNDSFSGLGVKTTREASKNLERLRETYGDNLSYLFGLSVREIWFSLFNASSYIALMVAEGEMLDNDFTQELSTAEGYGKREGIAWTISNSLSEISESRQQAMFRDGTPFSERLPLQDILNSAAVHWFATAATSYRAGNVECAFDWLSEAQDALLLAHGQYMWCEGERLANESTMIKENQPESISDFSRRGAAVRHAENRSMKSQVSVWLDANMPNFKSMDAAAQAVTKQQPIAFRTARDWVGEWRKVRSTGTP